MNKTIMLLLLILISKSLYAQDKIIPLKKSSVAPFSGLLVPGDRYIELLEAEQKLELMQDNVNVEKKAYDDLTKKYLEEIVALNKKIKNKQNLVIIPSVIAVTLSVIYITVEIIRIVKK